MFFIWNLRLISIMKIKSSLLSVLSAVMLFTACSKSSSDENSPQEKTKETYNVMQTLIDNFKGTSTLTTENENNDVIFGIKFTSAKDGEITKLRRSTGSSDRAVIKLWYNENNSWKAYKEQEIVATAGGNVFSGDTNVEGWKITKGVEYHIA